MSGSLPPESVNARSASSTASVPLRTDALGLVASSQAVSFWRAAPFGGNRPCFYHGLMDGVTIWVRQLSAGEVRAEYESGHQAK
jgi:hypothetical protein